MSPSVTTFLALGIFAGLAFAAGAAQSSSSSKSPRKKSSGAAKATPRPVPDEEEIGGFSPKREAAGKTAAGTKKKAAAAPQMPALKTWATPQPATQERSATPKPKSTGQEEEEVAPKRKKPATKTQTAGAPEDGSGRAEDEAGKTKDRPEAASSKTKVDEPSTTPVPRTDGHAANATLEPEALTEFAAQPLRAQKLIEAALALTKRQLTYAYGSADPESGGLDCSGTMYYLLRSQGIADVPRDSAGQYAWLRKAGTFRAVVSKSATSFEFDELQPGDLMFWSGTYSVEREIPVTHVMMYLGTEKKTKKRVMFGASDGRTYDGVQRWGVSVFDFKMPRAEVSSGGDRPRTDFLGYARIPRLRTEPLVLAAETKPSAPAELIESAAAEPPISSEKKTGIAKTSPSKPATAKPSAAKKSSAKKTQPKS